MTNIGGRLGQFHYNPTHEPQERIIGDVTFKIGISTALNAFGLIGTEYNGIFIVDDTNKAVVLDNHVMGTSGGFGPYPKQIAEFDRLLALSDVDFLAFIKGHPNLRPYVYLPEILPVAITCERDGIVQVVHRTATVDEAEEWIAIGLADGFLDEDDVEQGKYGIDAPEEMVNG